MPDESALNGAALDGQSGAGSGALESEPSDLTLRDAEGSEGASPKVPSKDGQTEGELRRQYQELQKKLGEQGNVIGTLKKERDQFAYTLQQIQANQEAQARMAAAAQHQQQYGNYPQQPPQDYKIPANQFFEDPDAAVDRKLEQKLGAFGRQMVGALEVQQYATAGNMARFASAEARRLYPEAFAGLNAGEVEQTIAAGVKNRVVPPQALTDPNTYAQLAWAIQGQRKGFRYATPVNPVQPVTSDLPGSGRRVDSDADEVELPPMNEEMRKGLRLAGYDPDKVAAKTKARIAEERKAKAGGR